MSDDTTREERLWHVLSMRPVLDAASVHCCVFGACTAMQSAVKSTDSVERKRTQDFTALWHSHFKTMVGLVVVCVALALGVKHWR